MARNQSRRHGGRSEGRGYVCTDPSTPPVSLRTRPQQASRLGCTEIPKTPLQTITTCTGRTASRCRYLTKSVCLHLCSPALQIYKAILTTPRETARQLSLTAGPEVWSRSARAILRVQKGERFAHTCDKDRFALRSETRTFDIMNTLYILASSPYIL